MPLQGRNEVALAHSTGIAEVDCVYGNSSCYLYCEQATEADGQEHHDIARNTVWRNGIFEEQPVPMDAFRHASR